MKDAVGAALVIVTVWPNGALVPQAFAAARVTVYVPAAAYVWAGFWSVDVLPSPKSHDQERGAFVEASVNATAELMHAKEGATKLAVGSAPNASVWLAAVPVPHAFEAVSVTV